VATRSAEVETVISNGGGGTHGKVECRRAASLGGAGRWRAAAPALCGDE
jgi:hypothetical protein